MSKQTHLYWFRAEHNLQQCGCGPDSEVITALQVFVLLCFDKLFTLSASSFEVCPDLPTSQFLC